MDDTGVSALLDELSDVIEDGKPALGNKDKRQIDAGVAHEIIDEIRQRFPEELTEARKVLRDKDDLLADAEMEGNRIIEDARNQALIIASEQEIVRIAQSQAEQILREAREAERQVRSGAEDYADNVLSHIQNTLETLTDNVHRSRERLNNRGLR
ncbi:MAG: ATPase [Actinomycetia bacterium]|nr:ATPase [Actinomycetes bacterium]